VYYIKKVIFIIVLVISTSGLYGYFNRDYISSSSIGIGNCGVVNDNSVIELLNNPALPLLNTKIGFESLYFIRPVSDEGYYNIVGSLNFRVNDAFMVFGGTYQEILTEVLTTGKYFFGFNYALLPDLYLGYRIDMIILQPSGYTEDSGDSLLINYNGFSGGIGVYYYAFDYLKVGVSYNGINLKDSSKYIVRVFNFGIDFQLTPGVNMYFQVKGKEDVSNSIGYKSSLNFGIDKELNRYIKIRAGLPGDGFSLGLSVDYSFIKADYSIKFGLETGNEHFIGLRILY